MSEYSCRKHGFSLQLIIPHNDVFIKAKQIICFIFRAFVARSDNFLFVISVLNFKCLFSKHDGVQSKRTAPPDGRYCPYDGIFTNEAQRCTFKRKNQRFV